MRVVALVSGGKDSVYSMMKCVEHGHEIVALANLYPPVHVGEELDSFMYQTVGHGHVSAIAEAMELPLYRREIAGTAVDQGLRYSRGVTAGDEVEDLHALLSDVLCHDPSVRAVCVGAILSNYQRSRVEAICERLGLASLAYLWQREQAALLDEMVGAGVEAVVVKVASLGLKRAHLGRTIAELQPIFETLHSRFGFHVCGEGGEYETFTLDCPLFKRRLHPTGARVVDHDPKSDVFLLSWDELVLCDKDGVKDARSEATQPPCRSDGTPEAGGIASPTPSGVDRPLAEGQAAWRVCRTAESDTTDAEDHSMDVPYARRARLGGGLVQVAVYGSGVAAQTDRSSAEQLTAALDCLRQQLEGEDLALSDVLMLRLYVVDLAEYAAVNAAYSARFAESLPAARLAVQLPLGAACSRACRVAVEALAWAGSKRLLHVQSLSEWAPRMIGPYCQLTIGGSVCHVAGSLGLVPSSMCLVDGGASAQAALALDNCAAVLQGLSMSASDALALVVYVVSAEDALSVHGTAVRWLSRMLGEQGSVGADRLPPLLVLQVDALPMNALVEAHLEAQAVSAPPLARAHWLHAEGPVGVECDVVVASQAPHASAESGAATAFLPAASATAILLLSAEADVTLDQLCSAVGVATARLHADLMAAHPSLSLAADFYARALYDADLEAPATALCSAMSEAVAKAGPWQCVTFALPVRRVFGCGGRERMAVQLHFALQGTSSARESQQ